MIATNKGPEIINWFKAKGISEETVADFNVRIGHDGSVIFPYGEHEKKRFGVPTGERSFRWPTGVDPILFNRRDLIKENLFLVEGETDTMCLRQHLGDNPNMGVVGLPGIETWNDGMAADLADAKLVYVILDNDMDYKVAGRVDAAWRTIRKSLGSKARMVKLPKTVNDLCEFFVDYSLDDLRKLTDRTQVAHESRFKTLNLRRKPEEPKWVVDGMFVQGDVHLIIGEPEIGKSWITMALAVAVANGEPDFLGHKVMRHGRVLYVDEENPEDLVIDRMQRLGLTEKGLENIRYINGGSVRLDKDPYALIDEAIEYEPVLVVLDSLTRLHGEDENSAGPMAALFNNGINPLARQAGACVVLIHHVSKTDSTSSFRRARGSSDIVASPDTGFDVYLADDGSLRFKNFKARRSRQKQNLYIFIKDISDHETRVTALSGFGQSVF